MRIDFVSLFPEVLWPVLGSSILARAADAGLVTFRAVNPRNFCYDRHLKVDDVPYGGQPGMLIRPEPVGYAVRSLSPGPQSAVVLTAPTGVPFSQSHAKSLATLDQIIFLCGHYEGFDHRVETRLCTHVFSIGDYVLTNGELPALVMADAVTRQLPGVLGDAASLENDSHSDGLLSAPNYTRPEVWEGVEVPHVLRNGDHKAIERWKRQEGLKLTQRLRPDLLAKARLTDGDFPKPKQPKS